MISLLVYLRKSTLSVSAHNSNLLVLFVKVQLILIAFTMDIESELVDDPDADNPGESRPTGGTRRNFSLVWNYFSKTSREESLCLQCKRVIKTPSGTTTNLHRHIKTHPAQYVLHKKEQEKHHNQTQTKEPKKNTSYKGLPCNKQTTITGSFMALTKWAPSYPKAKQLTKSIGKWISQNMHPFSIVEEDGFKEIMKISEPRYNVPSRTTFSRSIIPELYSEVELKIQNKLSECVGTMQAISFTTDMWTSNGNDSYISLTCHFTDTDFSIAQYTLGIYHFKDAHSAANITITLENKLAKWGLLPQNNEPANMPAIYIVTDNARNIRLAVENMEAVIPIKCFAHTLQLTISDIKKDDSSAITDLLKRARQLVGHYKHSSTAESRLKHFQKMLQKPELSLIQDVMTRWNSEYQMLERLCQSREAVSAELATNGPHQLALTPDEWECAAAFVEVLQPLFEATQELSGAHYPTLSMVLPVLYGIKEFLEGHIKTSHNRASVGLARNLTKSLMSRFPSDQYRQNEVYILAMVLDPRFKDVILRKVPHEKRRARSLLTSFAGAKLQEKLATPPEPQVEINEPSGSRNALWKSFEEEKKRQAPNENDIGDKLDQQITKYLNEPLLPRVKNPCDWWGERANRCSYDLLMTSVSHFQAIPATEVASERAFSTSGNVSTVRRSSLLQNNVEKLVFLHDNLKFQAVPKNIDNNTED